MTLTFCSKIIRRKFSLSCAFQNKTEIDYGFNKVEKKHLTRRLLKVNEDLSNHIYKTCTFNQGKRSLVKYLIQKELYNDEKLIAFEKPFGISNYATSEGKKTSKPLVQSMLSSSGFVCNDSITDVLPLLNNHYKKDLKILYCTERWMSGIVLLGDASMLSRVIKCFRRSAHNKQPHLDFWVVSDGILDPPSGVTHTSIARHYTPSLGVVPYIKQDFSKHDMKKRRVRVNMVSHKTIASNQKLNVSFLQASLLNYDHHFLRVWLAENLCPVFGDLLYGGRVRKLLSARVLLKPHEYAAYQPPNISSNILRKIKLEPGQSEVIPPHIHLSQMTLHDWNKGSNLVITSPPPEHFLWTCKKFDLIQKDDQILFPQNEADTIEQFDLTDDHLYEDSNL